MKTIDLHPDARLLLQRRLQSRTRSPLRARIDALRLRLGRYRRPARAVQGRSNSRFSPIERVMRRAAVHQSRSFTAHVTLQALLAAGITRHTQRVELRSLRGREVRVPGVPLRGERLTLVQRVLQERLLQRLAGPAASASTGAAMPHAPMINRALQRHAWRRPALTMVRTQPALPATAHPSAGANPVSSRDLRPTPPHPQATATPAPLVLPPQEMSRLTDHVIRELDHRILSWQERTARN